MSSKTVPSTKSAGQERRTVTVDDVLGIEGIGAAAFSPDGRWLAYNLVPPYDQLSDYSYWLRADSLSGHQLWISDLDGNGKPRLQPGLDPSATNYLVDFSPDGSRLVALEHKLGHLRLVACRIGRKDCVRFQEMPDIRDKYIGLTFWNERVVWVSSHSFVMPTRDAYLPGSEMRSRGIAGEFLWKEWNKAWRGDEPTASEVVSTIRDRSEEWASGELIEFDLRTGTTRVIAHGRYGGVQASPDRRLLIAARTGERERPSADAMERAETHPQFDRRYALRLIEIETGVVREPLQPFNVDPESLTWSPNGDRFAVFGWERGETVADGRFYIVDSSTLQARRVSHDNHVLANSRFNPHSQWPLGPARFVLTETGLIAFSRHETEDRFDWILYEDAGDVRNLTQSINGVSGRLLHADLRSISILSETGVYRIGLDGSVMLLASAPDGTLRDLFYVGNAAHSWANEFRFDLPLIRHPLGRAGALVADDDSRAGDRSMVFVDFVDPAAASATLAIDIPDAKVLAASRSANAAVVTAKNGAATGLFLIRGSTKPGEELARINTHLNHVAHPQTTTFEYTLTDPNGVDVPRKMQGCLVLPPNYDPDRRYPALIEVYPVGVPSECRTLRDAARPGVMANDLWAAMGLIYYRPAIPLDFARTDGGPVAGMNDVVDQAVDALIDQGYADPERLVLFGYSQGGISSLYVATQSDRFAAVISMNGWANFFSHYFGARGLMRYFHLDQNGGDNRWRYDCVGEGADHNCPFGFGVSPLDDPAVYARTSPVALAGSITAPVLLVHSDLDYFDMAQYDEMFGALYRAGKEARYVRYWGEGHGPSSPANIRDLWSRMKDFFVEHGVIDPH